MQRFGMVLALAGLAGCKPSTPPPDPLIVVRKSIAEGNRLDNALSELARGFYAERGRWPADVAELKAFAAARPHRVDFESYETLAFSLAGVNDLKVEYKRKPRRTPNGASGGAHGYFMVGPPPGR